MILVNRTVLGIVCCLFIFSIPVAFAVSDGEQLYTAHCSSCHVLSGVDNEGYAGDISGESVAETYVVVRSGVKGMKSFNRETLSDDELGVLASYINEVGIGDAEIDATAGDVASGGVEVTSSANESDWTAGRKAQKSAQGFGIGIALLALCGSVFLFRR